MGRQVRFRRFRTLAIALTLFAIGRPNYVTAWELVDDRFDASVSMPNRLPNDDLVQWPMPSEDPPVDTLYRRNWNDVTVVAYESEFNPAPIFLRDTPSAYSFSNRFFSSDSRAASRNVQVFRSIILDSGNDLPGSRPSTTQLTLSGGGQFFDLLSDFYWASGGAILGKMLMSTEVITQIAGPAAGAELVHTYHGWRLSSRVEGTFGIRRVGGAFRSLMGEDLTPGQTNALLYTQPTFSAGNEATYGWSGVAIASAGISREITRNTSLALDWNGVFVGDLQAAANSIRYRIPEMGIRFNPGSDVFQQTLMLNLNYAR